jgi:signal transduction histidine kinase
VLRAVRTPSGLAGLTIAATGIAVLAEGAGSHPPRTAWLLAIVAALIGGIFAAIADGRRGDALFGGVIGRTISDPRRAAAARAAVLVTAPLAGFGVIAYALAALRETLSASLVPSPEADWRRTAGVGFLGLAVVLVAAAAGLTAGGSTELWAALQIGAGLALFWGAAGTRPDIHDFRAGTSAALRTATGVLIAGSGVVFLATRALSLRHPTATVGFALASLAVIALIGGPWWLRTRRLLAAERLQRARAQERAEMADHLHDSVLQTLALIQRRSGDPELVAGLAHRQERDLRDWLLGRHPALDAASLDPALRALVAEIEDAHGRQVELVIAGDARVDAGVEAVLAATREALVNAARHAAGAPITVFARAEPARVAVFVRDRGPGFDPDAIAPERRGVRESILARMERHGGHAEIRTAPGEGCEVVIRLERT